MQQLHDRPAGAARAGVWLKCFKPNPLAQWRLLCFPFAGGGANFYRRWPEFFPPDVELHALQLPGRETRLKEPCVTHADVVSDRIIDELRLVGWRRPLVLFGHSMGSMLAYDLARKLQRRHAWDPALVIASGRQPPHVRMGGNVHRQPDDVLIDEIKRLNGTPDGVLEDAEMRAIMLPLLRGDYAILETYHLAEPEPLNCPIVTCVGDRDNEVEPGDMARWQELTHSLCLQRVFPGDHFFLKDQLPQLAGFIAECLMRTAAGQISGARGVSRSERSA